MAAAFVYSLLGYPLPADHRIFYRITNPYPVSLFILDKPNFELATNRGMFFAFGGGLNLMNQFEQLVLPKEFVGDTVYFVIENANPMPVTVGWEAGGFVAQPSPQLLR